MEQKINARFIIQIAGKPIENVEKALEIVLNKLKEENKFKVLESEIVEAELDELTTLYSGFIDILIRFNDVKDILGFIVDYTPNSVDVEEPENISFTCNEFTGILNDMSSNLLKSANEIRQLRAHIHLMNNTSKK